MTVNASFRFDSIEHASFRKGSNVEYYATVPFYRKCNIMNELPELVQMSMDDLLIKLAEEAYRVGYLSILNTRGRLA
jgi:hypothetical protein